MGKRPYNKLGGAQKKIEYCEKLFFHDLIQKGIISDILLFKLL